MNSLMHTLMQKPKYNDTSLPACASPHPCQSTLLHLQNLATLRSETPSQKIAAVQAALAAYQLQLRACNNEFCSMRISGVILTCS